MMIMAGCWKRPLCAALAAGTLMALMPMAAASPAPDAEEGPSDQQILDAFRDEWGRIDFRETRITDWRTVSTWERVAQFAFAPGSNEFTAKPVLEESLLPLRLEIFTRQARNQTQFQVTETASNADGAQTVNYFPIFTGTPESMEFFNAAGIPDLPAGEIQQHCRDFVRADRHFQLCRMIPADGSIRYHIKVEQGSSTEGLPSLDEVLGAFRDQWGTDTFRPSGATAWQQISAWQRLREFEFPEGGNEFNSTPIDEQTTLDFRVFMMRRTVKGKPEFQELSTITLADGTQRTDAFAFDRFRGDANEWFFYVQSPPDAGVPGGENQLHRKVVTIDGETFLLTRVIFPEGDPRFDIAYYPLRRLD